MQSQDQIGKSAAFSRHLSHLSPEDVLELGSAMEELEATRGWRIVCDVLDKERSAQMQSLVAEAGTKSEQQYARALGELKGLGALDKALQTIKVKAEEADLKLRQRLAGAAAEA